MGNLLAVFVLFLTIVVVILISVAAASHHCDYCGENLVRLTGNRWRCPKCGRHYYIGKLGLGKQECI